MIGSYRVPLKNGICNFAIETSSASDHCLPRRCTTLNLAPASSLKRDRRSAPAPRRAVATFRAALASQDQDRKSTRLNSSHVKISYAVFCLKKKNRNKISLKREEQTQTSSTSGRRRK